MQTDDEPGMSIMADQERGDHAQGTTTRRDMAFFARATIDALAQQIAVLDADGRILAVNKAWRDFAQENGANPDTMWEGCNYLGICEGADGSDRSDAAEVARLIRDVAQGKRKSGSWQYPCHSPTKERWFIVKVTRIDESQAGIVVVSHDDITERVKYQKQIEYLANHDYLTGTLSRAKFMEVAAERINMAKTTHGLLVILFLDVDNFKSLNDSFGHSFGDEVLRRVSSELIRSAGPDGTVARLGGDEFAILLHQPVDHLGSPVRVARSVLAALAVPTRIMDTEIGISVSIGISVFPKHGENIDELLKHADDAMYSRKKHSRGNPNVTISDIDLATK